MGSFFGGIFPVIGVCLLAALAIWKYGFSPAFTKPLGKSRKTDNTALWLLLAAALVARIICAVSYRGFKTDIDCFTAWADMIFKNGVGNFYQTDVFTDYPPGYMYILYVIGAIKQLFGISGNGYVFLVKLPSIIADLVTCWLIYKIASKHLSNGASLAVTALYAFNPAVLTTGELWGQVDSVYTVFIAFMVWLISERKLFGAYLCFAACILIKPHAFIYTPLIIFAIIENFIYPEFKAKELGKTLISGLIAIALMVLAAVPFGLDKVFSQYTATLSSYPYMTINAFNLWGIIGKNWKELTPAVTVIGYVFLALIVAFSAYFFFKSKNKSKYYFTAAILAFLTFMLSTKMHERYAFPAMLFLLLAFAQTKNIHNYALYITVTLAQLFNIAWVLFVYPAAGYLAFSKTVNVASAVNVAVMLYMLYIAYKLYIKDELAVYEARAEKEMSKLQKNARAAEKGKKQTKSAPAPKKVFSFRKTEKLAKIGKLDLIIIASVTLVYSVFALYDLGDMKAAETVYTMPQEETVTVNLGGDKQLSKIKFFLGARELNDSDRKLSITCYNSAGSETFTKEVTSGSVFYWNEETVNADVSKIEFRTDSENLYINEMGLIDSSDKAITPVSYSDSDMSLMFDEQDMIPERSNFRNGTYFDEIYHARTAYEFIHHLPVYEWTHPPLGKIIISLGIMIFGMCPFGWRIAGTVFGIMMVPLIYIFAKKLTKKWQFALVTCLLFTFDFMHFAQTRIATIDVYVTFFILLMYLFMFKYYKMSFYDTPLKKTLIPLALCGTTMGLAIASKWTGIYASVGLAIIFFYTLFVRYREYVHALADPKGTTDDIPHKYVIENFKPYMLKTIGWCLIFFVIVPLAIYCLSYIPYLLVPDSQGIGVIWQNQEAMLTYHGKTVLGSTHPFSSKWYEWIIMTRPIWYYSGTVADGIKEGISSFGNPAVWWMGIPAFIFMVYNAIAKRDKNCVFLIIAYIIGLIPWMGVERLTFIYHYFPCVPFIALMIGYSIRLIYDSAKDGGKKETELIFGRIHKVKFGSKRSVIYASFIYTGIAIVLFVMFYPVLSGQPCSTEYANTWLKWFDSWVLL